MSLESNKALAKKAVDIWSTGNLKAIDEVYDPSFQKHMNYYHGYQILKGPESMKKYIKEFREAFPDFHDTIEDQIAEGNKVVTRFTSRGTHKGKFMSIDPTGRKVSWTGIIIDRIENGKIIETWVHWDTQGLMEQLGVSTVHTIK